MSNLINNANLKVKILEIHSRLNQTQRNKTSLIFRESGNKIMFSSDVSARGMD